MKKAIYRLTIISLILLSGCGTLVGTRSVDLDNTSWTLVSYGGESLLHETAMTAVFTNGEISGSASCNHYFAGYQIKKDAIQISGLGWTEMACLNPEGIMKQEQALMGLLADATSLSVTDKMLELITRDGIILVFHPLVSVE